MRVMERAYLEDGNDFIPIPDMRSIAETAERFNLPAHLIRTLALEGKIAAIQAGGKKIYINQESLIDYLNQPHLSRVRRRESDGCI